MAVFEEREGTWERVDFQLLRDGPVTMYHKWPQLHADIEWLRGRGYRVCIFDASDWQERGDLFAAFADELHFAEHFGGNLDALSDSMSEVVIGEGITGLVVFIAHFEQVVSIMGADRAHALVDILATESRQRLLFGQRMMVLLQCDDDALELDSVGSTPVSRRE